MRICIIVDDYLPDSNKSAAKVMHELACEYISLGHKVLVITPNPNINQKFDVLDLDGVKVVRFKSGTIKNTNKIRRTISETLLSFNAWWHCRCFFRSNQQDYIIYHSPSIFWGCLVSRLKKLWGVKSYLVLRDFFPQWAIDHKFINEKSLINKYFKFFEAINYQAADRIGVMSPKNLEWFNKYCPSKKKVEVLYNWAKIPIPELQFVDYKKLLKLKNKLVFFFGGNIGHAQDMLNLVRLAAKMQNYPEAYFVFVGAGDEYDLVNNSITKNNLSNVSLLPSVSQSQYVAMLQSFDIGLFTLSKHHQTHNFPGKILGYMQYGLPILGSVNPNNDLKDIMDEFEAGFLSINGEDEILLADACKLLDSKIRQNISKNANKLLFQKFSVTSAAKQILD